jgi:hypothetical protein
MPSHALAKTSVVLLFLALFSQASYAGSSSCFPLNGLEPWNQPAPKAVHVDSVTYSTWLWNNGSDRPGNFNVDPDYAVYGIQNANSVYTAITTFGNMNGKTLRFNDLWKPYNTDKQIIVLSTDTRFTYEFFGATVDPLSKSIKAARGDYLQIDRMAYSGHGGNPGSRGIGIPYVSMLVLDCEIAAGRINHALSLRVARPKCHEAWWPATKIENRPDCIDTGMPEGAHFVMHFTPTRINAWAANLRTMGGAPLESFGRALADALQVYGFFITDDGGNSASFDVQHTQTWASSNPLKTFAQANPAVIRDMLDGLIAQGDISLVAEQGPRLLD